MVGRYGAEKLYEDLLQGQHGIERYVVNVKGRKVMHRGLKQSASAFPFSSHQHEGRILF